MDEQTHEVSPVRQEIDRLRASEALKNPFHPSHPKALETLSKLYSQEYREPDDPPPSAEEIEATKAEAREVQAEALKVDDPEAAKLQEELQPLREEWGSNYDNNVKAAQGLVEHLGREMGLEAVELFDDIGSHPTVIKACYEWSQGRDGGDLSPEQAKEVIALIQKSRVYQSGISETSEVLRNAMQALYTVAYGS
jgi:hypothetical protein